MEKIAKINKFYKNKNILITGNTGFIGSWLTLCLLKYKCKITGISKDQGQKTGIFNDRNFFTYLGATLTKVQTNTASISLRFILAKFFINCVLELKLKYFNKSLS